MKDFENFDPAWFEPCPTSDWDFEHVPDHELIACCLWEYARESSTIKMASDYHWCSLRKIHLRDEYSEDLELRERHDKEADLIQERLRHQGYNHDDYCDRFFGTDFPLLSIYLSLTELVRDGAAPWQDLDPNLRSLLIRKLGESTFLGPLRHSLLMELEELWDSNAAELLELRSKEWPPDDDRVDMHLYNESSPVEINLGEDGMPAEYVTVAFTVDFSRFTDTEITAAFQEWLKKNRPQRWANPRRTFAVSSKKGRKMVDYRVALERLGLMRLLHWNSPKTLREDHPAAWKKYRQKEPDFRREIRQACKFFHLLYPFLPPDELPESAERFGIWMPPLVKAAEGIEEEMRRSGGSK